VPNSITFDEFFETYSYLEDLDFSVSVGRAGRLAVVAEAGFFHFPSAAGRVSARQFGRFEIRNRLYFVRKHQLSLSRCYLGLLIRMTQSILGGMRSLDLTLWDRALGNAAELVITLASPTGEVVGRSTAI
jgi:GT2 family glycosyltransferase